MGYVIAMAECWACGRTFGFNPELVPSVRDPRTDEREPICQDCVRRANEARARVGMKLIEPIRGAYEPVETE